MITFDRHYMKSESDPTSGLWRVAPVLTPAWYKLVGYKTVMNLDISSLTDTLTDSHSQGCEQNK